jgi:NADPH:quinone reductase-like Zn-dependent oxidoreductase
LSGVVEEAGPSVSEFRKGDEIYGVTNPQFCGANAQYAVAHANMVALRPSRLSHVEAASAPVIAVTAWQMLFDRSSTAPITKPLSIRGDPRRLSGVALHLR